MLGIGFLLVNLIILGGWILCVASLRDQAPGEVAVFSGLLFASQIVLSEIVLGSVGLLNPEWTISVNLVFSVVLVAVVMLLRGMTGLDRLAAAFRQSAPRGPLGFENLALVALLLFVLVWAGAATWFLPPRGIDDLVYHLPPLYEYLQNQRISMLPVALHPNFAMPLGGEFLFLWPLIFFHDDRLVDGVQWVVALYGCAVIYAIARSLDVPRRDAFFVAALFLFTPVVLAQAGSNYVDLTVAVCHLTLVYACIRFWQTGSAWDLVFAGLATGFGIGIKYNMLPAVAAVQPIILLRLLRGRSPAEFLRGYGVYFACALPLGIYWLLRNYLETGLPLFPYALGPGGLRVVAETNLPRVEGGLGTPLGWFVGIPGLFIRYIFQDPGLGSFHGGFNVSFWAFGFPALVYVTFDAVREAFAKRFFSLLLWSQPWIALTVFFQQVGIERLIYNQRYIIAFVGFGLVALGILVQKFRKEIPQAVTWLKAACVGACGLAIIHMASYTWPSYQISAAVEDAIEDRSTSEYKYYRQSGAGLPTFATAWAPLDFITRGGKGWDVYMAVPWDLFSSAPIFGSELQNRFWNIKDDPAAEPDAFIFYSGEPGDEPFYFGRKITPYQVAQDGQYELVTLFASTEFWAKSALIGEADVKQRRIAYYARTFAEEIRLLEPFLQYLPDDGVLITSLPIGHALKYLELTGRLQMQVQLVPRQEERIAAVRAGAQRIITIGAPIRGYLSQPLFRFSTPAGSATFFDNRKP